MKRKYVSLAVVCVSILTACGAEPDENADSEEESTSTTAESTAVEPKESSRAENRETPLVHPAAGHGIYADLPVACGGEQPEPPKGLQFDKAEDQKIPADSTVIATVKTSCGDLVLELDPSVAPNTVNSFVFLAREGFYDGIVSHRLIGEFVLQIGDPTTLGNGGPGYSFADELPESTSEYGKGAVVMANSGPDTNGSQIFINFADLENGLQLLYSKFGQLVEGEDVLAEIEKIQTTGDSPVEGLYIESIDIEIQ